MFFSNPEMKSNLSDMQCQNVEVTNYIVNVHVWNYCSHVEYRRRNEFYRSDSTTNLFFDRKMQLGGFFREMPFAFITMSGECTAMEVHCNE